MDKWVFIKVEGPGSVTITT